MHFLRRPERSTSPRPKKKSRLADGHQKCKEAPTDDSARQATTLPVAGGPDRWSLRAFQLWSEQGSMCDVEIHCKGKPLIKATKLTLAAHSSFFHRLFSTLPCSKDSKPTIANVPDAEPGTLERLIRSIYEKEISLTPLSAPNMLALSHTLEVEVLTEVVEQYLTAQLAKDNAVDALFLSETYKCAALREAAIPLAAISFNEISLSQLEQLRFEDIKDLLASDHLILQDENALFQSVKCWSGGQRISSQPREADEQLLALIEEIRLENIPSSQLNAILDDNWMQQHPKVLTAVAKSLVKRTNLSSPGVPRKTRAGCAVRFKSWSKLLQEAAKAEAKLTLIRSHPFDLASLEAGPILKCHLQIYPHMRVKEGPQPTVGIFLAVSSEVALPGCTITLVNQREPKISLRQEYIGGTPSQHGSFTYWGSKRFISQDSFNNDGYIMEDTVVVSIKPHRHESLRQTPGHPEGAPASLAGT